MSPLPSLRYLAYRALELPVWLGVPAIGWAWAGGSPDIGETLRAGSMVLALAVHILTFNDWAGIRLNPIEAERYGARPGSARVLLAVAGLSLVAALVLALSLSALCAVAVAVASLLGLLYAHPRVHLKSSTLGSAALHYAFGFLQLLIGSTAVVGPDRDTLAFAMFFACLFTAGHWVHQVIDHAEDAAGDVSTTVHRLGPRRTLALARSTFVLAHAYLLALLLVGAVTPWVALLFSLPTPAHLRAAWAVRRAATPLDEQARDYRMRYRALFGLATLSYVVLSL